MAIYTLHSQFITTSITLVGIVTHSIPKIVEDKYKLTPSQILELRYKENRRFFWK